MKLVRNSILLSIIFILFLSACSALEIQQISSLESTIEALSVQSTVDRAIALTSQVSASTSGGGNSGNDAVNDSGGDTTGQVDTGGESNPIAPTDTPIPVATDTPIPAATATLSAPMIEVSVDTNCRVGPGQPYAILGALLSGEQTDLIAWDGYGYNYYVTNPDSTGYCWLWGQYATTIGDTSELPIFTPPPSPTPIFTPTPMLIWHGLWTMLAEGSSYSVTVTQSGNTVSGSFLVGADTATFTGTINANGKTVTGAYSVTNGTSGTFIWQLKKNTNQFVGHGVSNTNVIGDWCGYRAGSSLPSPCYGP